MKVKKNPVNGRWVMAESDAGAISSVKGESSLTPCDGSKILVVDDDARILQVFRKMISDHFQHVQIEDAHDGSEGFERFKEKHHGVIIMDLVMPVMDGFTAFQEIVKYCRLKKWEVPSVVFCTGYDPPQAVRSLVADNPFHCLLCKPVSTAVLNTALEKRITKSLV